MIGMKLIDHMMADHDGRCHWCDRKVKLRVVRQGEPTPVDNATVDHVYPRRDKRRAAMAFNRLAINHVLACYSCNNRRGNAFYDDFLKVMRPEWRKAVA
jgi:5-methylcytosine-specific restriction endonuclease McrA